VSVTAAIGGLRIKTINNYASTGLLATQKHFTYENVSYNSDRYPSAEDYLSKTDYHITNGPPDGDCISGSDYVYGVSSNPVNSWGLPSGNLVTYGKVTERYESGSDLIGKTVYEYEINP